MVRTTPLHPIIIPTATANGSPKRSSTGLLGTVTKFWAICTKQVSRTRNKLKQNQTNPYSPTTPKQNQTNPYSPTTPTHSSKTPPRSPRSPLTKPKQIFTTLSNKAINLRHKKRKDDEFDGDNEFDGDEGFGNGGLWQRNILMGDKCQPLDFSGVIYYDSDGKRLTEVPMRSPRASPLPSYIYTSAVKW